MSILIDPKRIRPYGDRLDDGKIQFSFSLPAPCNEIGKEAAKIFSTECLEIVYVVIRR